MEDTVFHLCKMIALKPEPWLMPTLDDMRTLFVSGEQNIVTHVIGEMLLKCL